MKEKGAEMKSQGEERKLNILPKERGQRSGG